MKSLPRNRTGVGFSVLAVIYGPAILLLALTVVFSTYTDHPLSFFSRDTTQTLRGHAMTGVQSNLGILVWCTAAVICLFSYVVLKRSGADKTFSSFLLSSSMISFVLTFDDLFRFHDGLVNRYWGIEEEMLFSVYGLFFVWYVIRFREIILRSDYLLLLLAFVFFGLSLVVDHFYRLWDSPWRIFFEDGFKLFGIVSWSGYLIRTCFQRLAASLTAQPGADEGI